jgi:hypothetical protein
VPPPVPVAPPVARPPPIPIVPPVLVVPPVPVVPPVADVPPVLVVPPVLIDPPVALAPPFPVPVVDSLFAHPSVAANTDAPSQHKPCQKDEGDLRIFVREVPSRRARGSKIHRGKIHGKS